MGAELLKSFRQSASDSGVIFFYSGHISQNVIATMSDALRQALEAQGVRGSAARKLFSSFVEMAQNVVNYGIPVSAPAVEQATESAAGDDSKLPGTLMVGARSDGRHYIMCGNYVDMAHVERIREKIESVRSMSLQEIKLAYREQLRNDSHTTEDDISKGAGLGFLTVARDASEPLEYGFSFASRTPSNRSWFYVTAIL